MRIYSLLLPRYGLALISASPQLTIERRKRDSADLEECAKAENRALVEMQKNTLCFHV
jgi:hypothetical protein